MAKRIVELPGSTLRVPRTKGAIRKNVEKFKDCLRIENKIKPGIFDEKRGITALLINNSGFYFVHDPKQEITNRFRKAGAA